MAEYSQFDKYNNLVTHQDLQNKKLWCAEGEKIEEAFVRKYGGSLSVSLNPVKKVNPYAPDLIYRSSGQLADLKTQNTPFFKADKLYNIDPSFAVVFNRKDYVRYSEKYPEIDVFFWIEWHSVKFVMGSFTKEVEYIEGVWKIAFAQLAELCKDAPEHCYQQRTGDNRGNAKSSFVLDIRNGLFVKVV